MGTDISAPISLNSKAHRESNIELLRIISMLGVIILHYNNESMGGALRYVSFGSANYFILSVFESLFICAVNLFVLISGYFLIETQKRSIIKPVKLLLQLMIFNVIAYFIRVYLGTAGFSVSQLVNALIPNNYFVILYSVLYFISPYINVTMKSLDNHQLKRMMITLIILFSIYVTITDVFQSIKGQEYLGLSSIGMYGSQNGYTIVNFALMYMIGAYIRLNMDSSKKLKTSFLPLTFFSLISIEVLGHFLCIKYCVDYSAVLAYCNPIVISLAVIVFLLFSRIDFKENTVINHFAKASFTVFLLHYSLLELENIQEYSTGNTFLLAGHMITTSLKIYLLCWLAYCIYDIITSPFFKFVEKRIGRGTYTVSTETSKMK